MTGLVLSAIIVTKWLSTTDFAYSTNAKLIFFADNKCLSMWLF